MRSGFVKVFTVLSETLSHLRLRNNDDIVQTFPSSTPDKSLTKGICSRGANRNPENFRPACLSNVVKLKSKLIIIVSYQKTRSFGERCSFSQLLCYLLSTWRSSDRKTDYASRSQFDSKECKYGLKEDVIRLKKIARPGLTHVVANEGCPSLSR